VDGISSISSISSSSSHGSRGSRVGSSSSSNSIVGLIFPSKLWVNKHSVIIVIDPLVMPIEIFVHRYKIKIF
jgi:hypothetical protein